MELTCRHSDKDTIADAGYNLPRARDHVDRDPSCGNNASGMDERRRQMATTVSLGRDVLRDCHGEFVYQVRQDASKTAAQFIPEDIQVVVVAKLGPESVSHRHKLRTQVHQPGLCLCRSTDLCSTLYERELVVWSFPNILD